MRLLVAVRLTCTFLKQGSRTMETYKEIQTSIFCIIVSKKFLVRRPKWRKLRMKNDGFVMATTVTVLMMVLAAFQGFVTS